MSIPLVRSGKVKKRMKFKPPEVPTDNIQDNINQAKRSGEFVITISFLDDNYGCHRHWYLSKRMNKRTVINCLKNTIDDVKKTHNQSYSRREKEAPLYIYECCGDSQIHAKLKILPTCSVCKKEIFGKPLNKRLN